MPIKSTSPIGAGRLLLCVLLLVLAVAMMASLRRCSAPLTLDSAPVPAGHSGGDTLDIAIEYSPVSYYSYADTLGGFNYDLLRLIGQQSSRPMKFHSFVAIATALGGLESGAIDVVAGQLPATTASKEQYLFTRPLWADRQVLVQRHGSKMLRSQLDLAGRTVWVIAGSTMRDRLQGMAREIGDTITVLSDTTYGPEQLVMRVASGEIELAVVNEAIATAMHVKYAGQIDIALDVSFTQLQSYALAKGNAQLLEWLDGELAKFMETGAYRLLLKRYGLAEPTAN